MSKSKRAPGLIQKGLSKLFPEPARQDSEGASGSPNEGNEPGARAMPTLAAVAQLRIQFLDNSRRPLYPLPERGTSPLSRDEEHVAIARCLDAIREAKDAGRLLGKPAVGGYAGREAEAVMAEVTAEDLKQFLAFVLANGRAFVQRPTRLSEAFLAWLVDRGSP